MPDLNVSGRTLFICDNVGVLDGMNSECVDLIYLDPPFNSNRHYSAPIGSRAAGAAFKDAWTLDDIDLAWVGQIAERHPGLAAVINAAGLAGGKGDQAYLIFMARRILEMHRILKTTGSIYLHCDPTMSHSLKMLMDSVFGKANFRNEIVWHYRRMPAKQRQFQRMHDVILFYSARKNKNVFHAPFGELTSASEKTIARAQTKGYNANLKKRMVTVFDWDKYRAAVASGALPSGMFAKESADTGPLMNACWTDIPIIAPTAKERTGYPTQKPLALLERIINASSDEGDVVFDPFCGCATTLVAA
ncbi:MAG: DNA methyltransferase, partial [Gammaproteobacteria bacterium]